jgi:hypothetical protein
MYHTSLALTTVPKRSHSLNSATAKDHVERAASIKMRWYLAHSVIGMRKVMKFRNTDLFEGS